MFSIASWNIRGMNRFPKHKEVQEVIRVNRISICAILESHIANVKLQKIYNNVFGNWDWISKNSSSLSSTRIIVGWDPGIVDVMVLSQTD